MKSFFYAPALLAALGLVISAPVSAADLPSVEERCQQEAGDAGLENEQDIMDFVSQCMDERGAEQAMYQQDGAEASD